MLQPTKTKLQIDSSAVKAEQWLPCPGYDDTYIVSSLGRVMRARAAGTSESGKVLKGGYQGGGYLQVQLWRDARGAHHYVHRLVARAFIGEPESARLQVNHKNSIRDDNRAINLEWVTPSGNILHGYAEGGMKPVRGESHKLSKLTEENVREIRSRLTGGENQRVIAADFGVHRHTVSDIKLGKTWGHVGTDGPAKDGAK